MSDPALFGLGPGHITVSTVGVIPRMLSLATDLPAVNLALSLHAPTQVCRGCQQANEQAGETRAQPCAKRNRLAVCRLTVAWK